MNTKKQSNPLSSLCALCLLWFLFAALPILLQLPDLLTMTVRQAHAVADMHYLERIFTTILLLPYDWDYCRIGVQGAFLRWPLGARPCSSRTMRRR